MDGAVVADDWSELKVQEDIWLDVRLDAAVHLAPDWLFAAAWTSFKERN